MSKWRKEFFCLECEEDVSWETKMGSLGLCPHCGFCSSGTVMKTGHRAVGIKPGPVRVAWTLFKLKVVRALLAPILKWHIRQEAKKTDRLDIDDPECVCGLITPDSESCVCKCGLCCPREQTNN